MQSVTKPLTPIEIFAPAKQKKKADFEEALPFSFQDVLRHELGKSLLRRVAGIRGEGLL